MSEPKKETNVADVLCFAIVAFLIIWLLSHGFIQVIEWFLGAVVAMVLIIFAFGCL